MVLDDDLAYEILAVVEEIPEGNVATYGQIARLIGREKNSRLVACVLSRAEFYGRYPCHRVVNRQGGLSAAFSPCGRETHRLLLEMEGVGLRKDGTVDLEKYLWR